MFSEGDFSADLIKRLAFDFVAYIENIEVPEKSFEETAKRLLYYIDGLAFFAQVGKNMFENNSLRFDDKNYEDVDFRCQRGFIERKFPEMGFYNECFDTSLPVGQGVFDVGDAIDDILDIYVDIKNVVLRLEKNSLEDGLWEFFSLYEMHWGTHAKCLSKFLHLKLFFK